MIFKNIFYESVPDAKDSTTQYKQTKIDWDGRARQEGGGGWGALEAPCEILPGHADLNDSCPGYESFKRPGTCLEMEDE